MYSQPGIVNVLDNGWMSPTYSGSDNFAGLQSAINYAQATDNPDGAIVLIPAFDGADPPNYGPYEITIPSGKSIAIPNSSCPLLICGTGQGTTLAVDYNGGTLFSIDYSGSPAWVTFQDLTVEYLIIDGAIGGAGIAFDLKNGYGVSFFRVNVLNCQKPFVLSNAFVNVLQCSANYDSRYPSSQGCTGLTITGGDAQFNIEQCVFTCDPDMQGSVGIDIDYSEWPRIVDSQISGFGTGINLSPQEATANGALFDGLEVDATGSCVVIAPQGTGPNVYDANFVACTFQPTLGYAPDASAIILSASQNSAIDTVRFTACTVVGYPSGNYGLEIAAGQNIQVDGGTFSGNAAGGIAITGGATEIQINGANCVGTSYAASTPTSQQYGIVVMAGSDIQIIGANCSGNGTSSSSGTGIFLNGTSSAVENVRIVGANCSGFTLGGTSTLQQSGIYINNASGILIDGCTLTDNLQYGAQIAGATNVTIVNCDLYSGTTGALGILADGSSGTPTKRVFIRNCNGAQFGKYTDVLQVGATNVSKVEITNCAGYNDQAVPVVPPSSTAPSGSFSGLTYGYYGPVAFYLASSSNTVVTIDGNSTHLTAGGFTLAPGETAQVNNGTIINFMMVGK